METPSDRPSTSTPDLEQITSNLVDFAIDRAETQFLLARWPKETPVKIVDVEYELQILKIITVGWSLSFFWDEHPVKEQVQGQFWQSIQAFSADLSETTSLMIGQDIDYFNILKERLDHYIAAMGRQNRDIEPAQVIAPEFAALCGDREDLFTQMAGGKMFNNTLIRVKHYLQTVIEST